jgi:hypothetical protein
MTTVEYQQQQQQQQKNVPVAAPDAKNKSEPIEIDSALVRKQIQQLHTFSLDQDDEWEQTATKVSKALSSLRLKWAQLETLRKSQSKVGRPSNRGGRRKKRNI